MKKSSKKFAIKRRSDARPTNEAPKAVTKKTSSKTSVGRNAAGKTAWGVHRVAQIAPAQRSAKTNPATSKKVFSMPKTMKGIRASIRRTMGY